jgi:hypothetical protein
VGEAKVVVSKVVVNQQFHVDPIVLIIVAIVSASIQVVLSVLKARHDFVLHTGEGGVVPIRAVIKALVTNFSALLTGVENDVHWMDVVSLLLEGQVIALVTVEVEDAPWKVATNLLNLPQSSVLNMVEERLVDFQVVPKLQGVALHIAQHMVVEFVVN